MAFLEYVNFSMRQILNFDLNEKEKCDELRNFCTGQKTKAVCIPSKYFAMFYSTNRTVILPSRVTGDN